MLEGSRLEGNSNNKNFGATAMRQLSMIAFVGIMVLPVASCGNSGEDINSTASLPQEAQTAPAAEPFAKPTVTPQSPIAVPSPGLIQPTNANQRAKQVQTGRQDPFAGLFLQTRPSSAGGSASQVASQPSSSSNTATPSPSTPSATGNGGSSARNAGSPPGGASSNGNTGSPPVAQDDSIPFPPPDEGSFPPPLPSIPEPELARKVAVSGVVQIGEQLQAIVQVPNEGTSRYVRVGQRLSNGEILVKRIEMSPGIEPVVILEQYGVEVSKAIGEQSVESDAPDTTTPTPTQPPEAEVEEPEPASSPEVTSPPTPPSPPEGPEPASSPEVTSPTPPAASPVPVPITPPAVPNTTPVPSPPAFTPGPGEF